MTSPADAGAPSVPAWFTAALAATPEERMTTVEGTDISYRAWGDPADRGIVLVHGGAAHACWWDHIAPLLTNGRRVVALDLSGHGDSGRRNSYNLDTWSREVLAVAADARITSPPTVIGHSMGGLVTLRLASLVGSSIAGAVAIDSPVRELTPEDHAARQRRAFGPMLVYRSRQAAESRFRPVPDQPMISYVAEHVAATSVTEVEGGWTWKYDPRIFARAPLSPELLTRPDCRLALFRAEYGIMAQELMEVMHDRLGGVGPVVEIPAAGHHVMLDQPIALVTALRTLLADWDHSLPDPVGS